MKKISCIAHRGASASTPENTMLALWTAHQSNSDIIEIDVQITKDRQLVLFHDRDMKRITNSDHKIADYELSKLLRMDVGSWKHENFNRVKIPTFKQAISELPKNMSFIVEVKPQKVEIEKGFELERLILEELDNQGKNLGSGYISVRNEESYNWIKENSSKYPIGMMQKKRTTAEFLEIITSNNIEFAQIRWRNYSKQDIDSLRQTGTKIIVYYADYPKDWDILLDFQVDGILTNTPDVLNGYLKMKAKKNKD